MRLYRYILLFFLAVLFIGCSNHNSNHKESHLTIMSGLHSFLPFSFEIAELSVIDENGSSHSIIDTALSIEASPEGSSIRLSMASLPAKKYSSITIRLNLKNSALRKLTYDDKTVNITIENNEDFFTITHTKELHNNSDVMVYLDLEKMLKLDESESKVSFLPIMEVLQGNNEPSTDNALTTNTKRFTITSLALADNTLKATDSKEEKSFQLSEYSLKRTDNNKALSINDLMLNQTFTIKDDELLIDPLILTTAPQYLIDETNMLFNSEPLFLNNQAINEDDLVFLEKNQLQTIDVLLSNNNTIEAVLDSGIVHFEGYVINRLYFETIAIIPIGNTETELSIDIPEGKTELNHRTESDGIRLWFNNNQEENTLQGQLKLQHSAIEIDYDIQSFIISSITQISIYQTQVENNSATSFQSSTETFISDIESLLDTHKLSSIKLKGLYVKNTYYAQQALFAFKQTSNPTTEFKSNVNFEEESSQGKTKKLSKGQIAGIVTGAVIGIGAIYFIIKSKLNGKSKANRKNYANASKSDLEGGLTSMESAEELKKNFEKRGEILKQEAAEWERENEKARKIDNFAENIRVNDIFFQENKSIKAFGGETFEKIKNENYGFYLNLQRVINDLLYNDHIFPDHHVYGLSDEESVQGRKDYAKTVIDSLKEFIIANNIKTTKEFVENFSEYEIDFDKKLKANNYPTNPVHPVFGVRLTWKDRYITINLIGPRTYLQKPDYIAELLESEKLINENITKGKSLVTRQGFTEEEIRSHDLVRKAILYETGEALSKNKGAWNDPKRYENVRRLFSGKK